MSALNGIFNWHGRPVSSADLASLAQYCRVSGPHRDGCGAPRPGLALQAHLLCFDCWSAQEEQPHSFANGSVLTWDGRLDNREDLLAILHHDLTEATDVVLVAAAYQRWGLDCLPRLLGDWCLALWDAAQERLVLATDYMRNRPLYYRETRDGLAWATRLEALVECYGLHGEPNDAYIAGLLTTGVPRDLSPYESVRMLRPGHWLVASRANRIEIRRYWKFSPARIRYRDPTAYTEHLRALLTEAVRVRLRAARPVWGHLSGGWDSGTLVCLANTLVRHRLVDAPALRTVSLRFRDAESDEQPFIAAIERWCRLSTITTTFTGLPEFPELPSDVVPFQRGRHLFDVLEAPVRAQGDHIVLSGELGDVVMFQGDVHPPPLLEPLHEGRVREFYRLCLARARARRQSIWTTIAWILLAGYGPLPHVMRLRRWMYPNPAAVRPMRPPVTTTALVRAPLPEEASLPDSSGYPSLKRGLVASMYRVAGTPFTATPDYSPHVWRTYPYAHRPLVEFILGAPTLAFWHPTRFRAGMQGAFPGVLPPEMFTRTTKGDARAAFSRDQQRRYQEIATRAIHDRPAREWELVRRGHVDAAILTTVLARLGQVAIAVDEIDMWFELEAWLRHQARSTATVPAATRHEAVAPALSSASRA